MAMVMVIEIVIVMVMVMVLVIEMVMLIVKTIMKITILIYQEGGCTRDMLENCFAQ